MTAIAAIPPGETLGGRALRILLKNRSAVLWFSVIGLYAVVAVLGTVGALPDFQERGGGSYEPPSLSFA